jgi:integrase/recombinase XerD
VTRIVDPARRCLHVREWPLVDQVLWNDMFAARELEDESRSPAAAWRPGTAQTNREGYGRWINFLKRSGADLTAHPPARVTPAQVRNYLAELKHQNTSIQTRCNRIAQLMSVMLAVAPNQGWSWLKRRFNHLEALANENRRQSPLPLLSGDILDKALAALRRFQRADLERGLPEAIAYRNYLMVAMATLVALRRHNFATLSTEQHIRRIGEEWLIEIPAAEAKAAKPITMPIPPILYSHIRYYLDQVRPTLLDGRKTDRLWITTRHTPMTDHSVYIAMTSFTRQVFGTALNPHRFRHIGATTIVIAAPEKIEAARAFLAHGDRATTQDHYILGQSLAASRRQASSIARLRRTLPGASRPIKTATPRRRASPR